VWPKDVYPLADVLAGEEVSSVDSAVNDEAIGRIAQYLVDGDLQVISLRFSIESHCVNGRLETV